MDDSAAGLTKTVVDAMAIGIQFSMQLPLGRTLAFSTACLQDIANKDLDLLLRKLCRAADAIDATYRLHALHTEIEYFEKELETARQNTANFEAAATQQWEANRRNGPIKFTDSQVAALKNFRNQEEGAIGKIKNLRAQQDTMERLIEAP